MSLDRIFDADARMSMWRPHEREAVLCEGGRTKSEFKDECDINVLMKRYEKQGVLPNMRVGQAAYVDCTVFSDFQTSMQIVHDAERMFLALPSRVRLEFDNDPVKFVAYAQDPANRKRLVELGLAEPPPAPPEPVEVKVVNPEPRSPAAS